MNPTEQEFFKPFFNEDFLRKSNVVHNSIELNKERIPTNLEFLTYVRIIKLLKSLIDMSEAETASPDDLEKIRQLFSYGDDVINRSRLIHWLKALLFEHFKGQDKERFLEIFGEKVREEEDEHPSQFVLDQAAAAQQKREKRDQEEAAREARIAREAREAREARIA